ncbi:hypothetical protein [Acinetobacter indicus]|uniref:hypothetical protein n=1 Tax=Acinetobacter indicus TaxID=756892 RepID=UPI00209B2180|nr:hypothetical protein [Acinetobacter indicus]MCO8100943.1 hypothetical protein [Acinetobacter indicus]MCO8106528.1 hypothetical protein [Acinetobacter indicus]MCO8112217.1 hypothetical protein [Acinetobacter indicus]
MKANEFVKKFGWTGFKIACQHRAINRYKYTIIWSDEIGFSNEINKIDADWTFESKDVLRLIASHELVEKLGGLESAKKELHRQSILRWINPETERLRVAIADVESCQ